VGLLILFFCLLKKMRPYKTGRLISFVDFRVNVVKPAGNSSRVSIDTALGFPALEGGEASTLLITQAAFG